MHKQLYPKRWREIREAVKERAHYRCEECGIEEGTIQISRHTGRRYILYLHAAHLGDNPRDGHQRNLRCLCPPATCGWIVITSPRHGNQPVGAATRSPPRIAWSRHWL